MIHGISEFLQKSFGSKSRMETVYSANNQPEAVDGFISWLLSSGKQSQKELPLLEPKSNWENLLVK
jgi:hypothetical protein